MRYAIVIMALLVVVDPGSCYFSKFLSTLQKTWMRSWERMRDQNLRPRLIKELHVSGSPTLVTVVDGPRDEVEVAINIRSSNASGGVVLMRLTNVTSWLKDGTPPSMSPVGRNIGWPNSVGKVEGSILPGVTADLWWASTVFFPETADEGRLVFLPLNGTRTDLPTGTEVTHHPIRISSDLREKNWYYSEIKWADMNQDGYPDIVTSRSRGLAGSVKISELVWFEHPGSLYRFSTTYGNWHAHSITRGPDVAFEVLRIPLPNGDSRQVLIGAGYWDNKLYVVWTDDEDEDWNNEEAIKERVIDNHGWFFDLQLADVNADGRDDILVTTWSYGSKQGSVLAYEVPCDFMRDEWRKHVIIDAAYVKELPNLASGGKINAFHPVVRHGSLDRKKKPFIAVSGDDDGHVYVLIPDSPNTNNWQYTKHVIYQSRGAVGAIAIEDLDHDGFNEILVPVVSSNKVMVFSYKPGDISKNYFVDERRRGTVPQTAAFSGLHF